MKNASKCESDNHAFLILTDNISESVKNLYMQISAATSSYGETFIIYHNKKNNKESGLKGYRSYEFFDEILVELGYNPVAQTLIPGSNHFPILKFYLDHPKYGYYWCIEDDVIFNGEWGSFFNKIIKNIDYDFISSYISTYSENLYPEWSWWSSLTKNGKKQPSKSLLMSFNPIYSLSNIALKYLDIRLKSGWCGHHEVLIPSLLSNGGFVVKDFGSSGSFVPKELINKFYSEETHRWRPKFRTPGKSLNKIYHPVKTNEKLKSEYAYKISFCIIDICELNQLKIVLKSNVEESSDYGNCEFLIFDQYKSGIYPWLKENMSKYLDNGTLVYFESYYPYSFNNSHAKNTAFKLASGEILSDWPSDKFTEQGLFHKVNAHFKSDINLAFTYDISNRSNHHYYECGQNALFVKKDDFLAAGGFDENLTDASFAKMDFLRRLRLQRINIKALDSKVKATSRSKNSLRKATCINQILIQKLNPKISTIIVMYTDSIFRIETLQNNLISNHRDFRSSFVPNDSIIPCGFDSGGSRKGSWVLSTDDETLIFNVIMGAQFELRISDDCYIESSDDGLRKFYPVTDKNLKNKLMNILSTLTTSLVEESIGVMETKSYKSGFGEAVVICNSNIMLPQTIQ